MCGYSFLPGRHPARWPGLPAFRPGDPAFRPSGPVTRPSGLPARWPGPARWTAGASRPWCGTRCGMEWTR